MLGLASSGATRQALTKSMIESFLIAYPALDEQRAIAKILGDLDEKIELNHRMNKTLEAIAQALFKRWFVGFNFPDEKDRPYKDSGGKMIDSELGEIPVRWRVSKVGAELKTILGGTPSRAEPDYWRDGTIPWINSGKANEFRIVEPSEYITEAGLENSATK